MSTGGKATRQQTCYRLSQRLSANFSVSEPGCYRLSVSASYRLYQRTFTAGLCQRWNFPRNLWKGSDFGWKKRGLVKELWISSKVRSFLWCLSWPCNKTRRNRFQQDIYVCKTYLSFYRICLKNCLYLYILDNEVDGEAFLLLQEEDVRLVDLFGNTIRISNFPKTTLALAWGYGSTLVCIVSLAVS